MQPNDKFEAYQVLRDSQIGKDLIDWIEKEYQRRLLEASKTNSPEKAFGLLKSAYGIISVKEYIELMANNK